MKLNLFFNHYKCDRQAEIDYCLEMNRKVFDNVFVIKGRPTFEYIFNLMNQFPNDINAFCNSDIYFKDTSLLREIKENECYALTRWNQTPKGLNFFNRADSQDAWIFKGAMKKIEAKFTTGKWGCDNRVLHEISKAGYVMKNPSLSIVTIHVHEVDNRNPQRTTENTVPPPYKTIQPHLI